MDQQTSPQDNQNQQPGSLNFVPASGNSPEATISSLIPTTEALPTIKETLKSIENEPTPQELPKESPREEVIPATTQATTSTQQSAKIVDKSASKTSLHHIENPQDKLTAEADKEEEEFIEEVEAAHDNK